MKLIGLMPVRNEAYCLGLTLRAALMWCDEMVVYCHACTDDSYKIARDVMVECVKVGPSRVWITESQDSNWNEMEHRQHMLCHARAMGATHIAIVDADEIPTGNLSAGLCPIREIVRGMPKGSCLQLPMYQLRGSLDRYHSNGIWGNRWLSVAFQDDPRLSWSGDTFHSREPGGMALKPYRPIQHGQGGSFHLWGVSERRLRAKHALYKVTERLRWPAKPILDIERMYNLWRSAEDGYAHNHGRYGDPWTYADVPAEWWAPYADLAKYLYIGQYGLDLVTWQEAEVRRLVAEHGAEAFKGLDLFGVA